MKLRIRLVIWLLLAITVTGGFSWFVSSQATEKMTLASLEKRTAIIGQSIQSTNNMGEWVKSQDEAELRTMTASLGNRVGLQELDLAWNSIRGAGAVKLFTAMAKDCKLKVSNASLMFRVTARLASALFSN